MADLNRSAKMILLRRMLFVPLSAVAALVIGFSWAAMFSGATYSEHHLFYSVIGLAPLFFGRLLPVTAFVVLGTIIAPRPGKGTVSCLGVLGGLFGWPFGTFYEVAIGGPVFYLTAGVGAIVGAGVGMLLGFPLARRKKRPNQPPQRNAGSRPSSDDSPASETPSSPGPRG